MVVSEVGVKASRGPSGEAAGRQDISTFQCMELDQASRKKCLVDLTP